MQTFFSPLLKGKKKEKKTFCSPQPKEANIPHYANFTNRAKSF